MRWRVQIGGASLEETEVQFSLRKLTSNSRTEASSQHTKWCCHLMFSRPNVSSVIASIGRRNRKKCTETTRHRSTVDWIVMILMGAGGRLPYTSSLCQAIALSAGSC